MAEIGVKEYLLQREPILMVDGLLEVSEKECVTSLEIKPSNFFVDQDGLFCEAGVIEHIAQSCSVLVGWNARRRGEKAAIGYIGEVKKCVFGNAPAVGSVLTTHVKFISEAMGVTLAAAETRCGDRGVATCKLKISL